MVGQNNNLRKVETRINQHLFVICSIVTLATMALMAIDFFTRGSFLPAQFNLFYLAVVLVYSLHKELLRWLGDKQEKRQGEIFVYGWILLTTLLYVANFFSKGYYSFSKEGYPVGTLRDISLLTVEILIVFILTRFLKLLEVIRHRKKP
ncbi:MAG: hypothetical protein Q8N16_03845 [bacterium]|nr:hypothetical protein [bacterium]